MNAMPTDRRTLALFAAASAATVALGSFGLFLGGAGPGTWLRNPAAWLVGLAIAALIVMAGRSTRLSLAILLLAPAVLAATFFSPGQAGVHRWIDLGPLHINMAAMVIPAALVVLGTLNLPAPQFLGAVVTIGGLLMIQPDASQATGFLSAAGFLVIRSGSPSTVRIAGTLGIGAMVVAAWLRPDRLQPVPEVEGIFIYIAGVSPVLAISAALALAATSLVPLRRGFVADCATADAAKALALYFTIVALMPLIGPFPVPLVGLGMSFPVGYWVGVALLCAAAKGSPAAANSL